MATVHSPSGYRVITAQEAEERFAVSARIDYPYQEFVDAQEIRLYEGGLTIAGNLAPEPDLDGVEYNTIVDGDLVVGGDLDWHDDACGNFVLVTGDLRARNLFASGCPTIVVDGDLELSGGFLGYYGDDGGVLSVTGSVRAPLMIATMYFNLELHAQPESVLIADPYRTTCPVDFTDDELPVILLPELLDEDGESDIRELGRAMQAGRQILRTGVRPSHLVALDELDALTADAAAVTSLDLSRCKLRGFPEQLLGFPHLRRLSLAGNPDLEALDPRIGELTSLEQLDLSDLGLEELPESLGTLAKLRVLDISSNRLKALPASFGRLGRLETLKAGGLRCEVPQSLAELTSLRELDLSALQPGEHGEQVDFPAPVTRLSGLRVLDLSSVWWRELPDSLLELTELEELDLDGALSAILNRLPELARLPRLRVLHLDGRTPWTFQPEPSPRLLDAVWPITTLEHLDLDRWGAVTDGDHTSRPALALPEQAFAAMPRLRHLDLSFNDLTSLPSSFFALRHLEFASLEYTELDKDTVARLRAGLPEVRLDLRNVTTLDEPDHPNRRAVHDRVAAGGARLSEQEYLAAVTEFEAALELCTPTDAFSEYDRLYAHYGLVEALASLYLDPAADHADLTRRLMARAEQAMALIPDTVWHFTEFGAFQEEVQRRAGNALAWHLMLAGELPRALEVVDRAMEVAEGAEHDYVRDTRVRILLKMDRVDEAYLAADQVLSRDPGFADLADIAADDRFRRWRRLQYVDNP